MEERTLHQKRTEPTFIELIDRLKVCSEINHPDRPWSEETKVNIAFEWVNKYDELKTRVETLETKILKDLYND